MENYYLHENIQPISIFVQKKFKVWIMYFYGARYKYDCGSGVIYYSIEGQMKIFSFTFSWICTKNVVEYEALCLGLSKAISMGIICLIVHGDFELYINQMRDKISARYCYLKNYRNSLWDLLESFLVVNKIVIPIKYN